jgi:protein SCO1
MRASRLTLVAVMALGMVIGRAWAPGAAAAQEEVAHEYFSDVTLVDQAGAERRLYSDLMDGKVVVINTFFTSCQASCPIVMHTLSAIQEHLGPRMGRDVHFLSLTVDRATDTPERLQEYARKIGAGPGWYLLTGTPEHLELALRKLGLWVEVRDEHSNLLVVGNVPTGLWKKALGLATTSDLEALVDTVLADTGEPASPGD